ncbi:MAG: aminoacyl-tRNA hydrolase [Gammaproteobacteria bacterium]
MATPIELVVGLGNPGEKYHRTRHNVGFWFLDALAQKYDGSFRHQAKLKADVGTARLGRSKFYLAKPTTYMNLSGDSVVACANYYRIEPPNILVVHDELDLPAGVLRLKQGGGHGGHNGLRDIIKHIGSDFVRLRIGVGDPTHPKRGANFVLNAPPTTQAQDIEAGIARVVNDFQSIALGELSKAMNTINRKE